MKKSFKHSGAFGDLLYSLPVMKHFGGGDLYLHLNQMNWVGKYYYNSPPVEYHQGRLTQEDFDFMHSFMVAQGYINDFCILDSKRTEITHNLDRFRKAFAEQPGNYVDINTATFGIHDPAIKTDLRTTPWLTVPEAKYVAGRHVVINRTARWVPGELSEQWQDWSDQGMQEHAVFLGLPKEHAAFCAATGWIIPHQPTKDMLEMAQYIAGSKMYIGNQSMGLALAIGLGVTYYCEARTDIPLPVNECYFPGQPNGYYF